MTTSSPTPNDEAAAASKGTRGREAEWGRRFAALTLAWLAVRDR